MYIHHPGPNLRLQKLHAMPFVGEVLDKLSDMENHKGSKEH